MAKTMHLVRSLHARPRRAALAASTWPISVRLPDGQISSLYQNLAGAKSSPSAKNILLPFFVNICFSPGVPSPPEGRFAIVTDVGSGMRWTCWLRKTGATGADGEIARSWHPDAGVKPAGDLRVTVAKEPGTPGRTRISRKPSRGECRNRFGVPVVKSCLCAFSLRTQGCGCDERPAFPAPSVVARGTHDASPGRISAAGMRRRATTSLFEI
jgi:hypothetical protein